MQTLEKKRILIAYFSHSGNTRIAVNQIREKVGGDIFEIIAIDKYPTDYDEVVEQAKKELNEQYKPKLKTIVENMQSYDVIFVAYPNWWGTVPMPVATFLSEYDFSGKTIAPVCTNEGSQLGRSITYIKKLCPKSTVLNGLAIRGSAVITSQNDVSKWLRELGMTNEGHGENFKMPINNNGLTRAPEMKYRKFGKIDFKPSALGFGAMRFPIIGGDSSKIDEPIAVDMIRYAIDHGVNYVDSAYVYHKGQSEVLVGKALKDGYREKVKLATKMPCWLVTTADDFDKYFNEQLQRLQTDHIDFYLLHSLGKSSWPRIVDLGAFKWAEKKIKEGKIRNLGFSFHDELPLFKEIVDAYDWDFCQIQYNYMDTKFQAGKEGLRYAAKKGIAVVIMEPIAGGRLAVNPPEGITKLWKEGHHHWKPAEWALQWLWNQPEVSIVLSGMSTMEQVVENVRSAGRGRVGRLTKEDLVLVDRVAKKYREMGFVGCTGCRYCMPCPSGVAIPEIFSLFNEFYMKDRDQTVKTKYKEQLKPEQWAKNCVSCGRCEELCPQHLPIKRLLVEAAQIFEMNW